METTRREAARAVRVERVKATARAVLARQGAANLSLREVAREMHQSSSALYRYFANRDDLLTALIVDAYNDLGAAAERADARVARSDLIGRWRAACRSVRRWARAHPNEYALIYGSPVPGYRAPEATVVAAGRVTSVLGAIVADRYRSREQSGDGQDAGGGHWGRSGGDRDGRAGPTHEAGAGREPSVTPSVLRSSVLASSALDWSTVAGTLPGVPEVIAVRAILVWAELFGLVSFELFGHLAGSVAHPQVLFDHLVDQTAAYLGIVP